MDDTETASYCEKKQIYRKAEMAKCQVRYQITRGLQGTKQVHTFQQDPLWKLLCVPVLSCSNLMSNHMHDLTLALHLTLLEPKMLSRISWIISVSCILIGVIQIYGFQRFRSLRNLLVINRRYPHFVCVECLACIVLLMIGIPLWTIGAFNDTTKLGISDDVQLAVSLFPRALNICLAHFITDIEVTRLFLMSFDLNWTCHSRNQNWKCQIDYSFAERDWYLQNRNRWGNSHYVFKRASIYYFIAVIITVALWVYGQVVNKEFLTISSIVDAVFFVIPLIIINTLYCKTPNIGDTLFFHFEYQTTAVTVCIGFLIYVSAAMTEAHGSTEIGHILAAIAGVFTMSMPSLLSTIVIPYKIQTSSLWVCFCSL